MASVLGLRRLTYHSLRTRCPYSMRPLSSASTLHALNGGDRSHGSSPSPPRLPKEEQEYFEMLQKNSTGAFSSSKIDRSEADVKRNDEGEEMHPDAIMGPKPEFEGDTNPKTGEVGGPKNNPLRWGAAGDWSYSGRVTDF